MTVTDISSWHSGLGKVAAAQALGSGPRSGMGISQMLVEHLTQLQQADHHAQGTPHSATASLASLAHHLATPFKDELFQLRAVFCWVAGNIAYDYKGYLSGNRGPQTAEAVLHSRVAVCEGYANLFLALCELIQGTKVFKITGGAMGVGLEAGDASVNLDAHAWNAVLIHGEYRFIETTWAAGTIAAGNGFVKHYNPDPYFLVSPTQFIFSHIPKLDPSHQFLSTPLTHKEWIELPHLGPAYHPNGTTRSANPSKTIYNLRAYVPHGDLICRVMASKSPTLDSAFPALTFRVKNLGPGKTPPAPTIYKGSVTPVDPIVGQLTIGKSVQFRVQGPHLEGIVMSPSKKIIKMERDSDFQIANVLIDEHGDWRVGHVNGHQYSFGAAYKA
ncbi:hypothetical protein HDU98_006433 [Podochytrium sp. JEL0797]|nr:hypothetical protein HDU98_006433 [Podochytrium sp. JEL0797]